MTWKMWLKQVLIGGGMAVGWIGLSVWQAGSWRLGIWVVIAVGVAILLLMAGGKGMLMLVRKIPLPNSLILRYGIKNLYRPGRQIMTIILSLGVGIMVLLTLFQVEKRLMAELHQNIPENAPGLFFIDIQPDQKQPFETMLSTRQFEVTPKLTPLIRSRLHAVDGEKISEIGVENHPDSWYFTREYVLTYQEDLPEHNIILRGQWWKEGETDALISVDSDVAYHLGIDIGSTVTFDIQGVQISGKVTSVREVDWGSMTTNFYFIFSPAAMAGAPETFVATVTTESENDLPVQNAIIGKFPNVTVIPIRELLETIARILMEITRTVQVMAALGLLVGLIVLSGAIVATRAKRVHEMVLFKTLGATRPTLIGIMAVEYILLGILAAIVGGSLSIVVSWGVVRFFLDIPWQIEWGVLFVGTIGTVALTLLTGFLTTYRILGEKPLAILRAE
jgi:putative ABC transport system permease protein